MSRKDLRLEAARRVAAADAIVIDNPRARQAHDAWDRLREQARAKSVRGTRGGLLVAPTQTGKSTIIQSYEARDNTKEALSARKIPVLVVTLSANVTRKGLAQDILKAIQEFGYKTGWERGTEATLLDRVSVFIKELGVEILILDEFHHVIRGGNAAMAISVAETIKWLLIKSVCPVVMSGIEEASQPVEKNKQLGYRCDPPIKLKALELKVPEDKKLFGDFLTHYLVEIERLNLVKDATSILDEPGLPGCIGKVTSGVLGRACNLVKDAMYLAVSDGRKVLTADDFANATDMAYVANRLRNDNPFLNLPGELQQKRGRAA